MPKCVNLYFIECFSKHLLSNLSELSYMNNLAVKVSYTSFQVLILHVFKMKGKFLLEEVHWKTFECWMLGIYILQAFDMQS